MAGGLEEISYYSVLGCQRSGIISKRGVLQPFGTGSDGMVCGEGCAIMLLETAEHAEARSAQVIGEICGFGSAFEPCDTRGNCLNQGKGIRHSIESACHDADITPDSLGFVAAGANGIIAHDREEAANISAVLGDIPVTSYKGKTGECYGASPVLSMVCALADMKLRRITGINAEYDTLQEANIVRSGSIPLSLPRALIHSFSCDGNCGSIILSSK